MSPLKAVLFDLDETLLDDDSSYDAAVRAACGDLVSVLPGLDLDRLFMAYRVLGQVCWEEVAELVLTGKLSGDAVRLDAWRRTLAEHGCNDEQLADRALAAYSRRRVETYALFDQASAVLQSCGPPLRRALITNGAVDTQREKVRILGIERSFDALLISGEVGVAKPDPRIFLLALERLGVAPHEALHVGDSLESDVAGAKAAGITAVWLNRSRAPCPDGAATPDFEIESLSELPGVLERLA